MPRTPGIHVVCMKTNANTHKLFNNNNKCNAVCRGHYLERSAGWGRTSAVISAQCTRLRCSGVRAARETSRTPMPNKEAPGFFLFYTRFKHTKLDFVVGDVGDETGWM